MLMYWCLPVNSILLVVSTFAFLRSMGPSKLTRVVVILVRILLYVQFEPVGGQYIAATSIVSGQAEWQGTPVSTNPVGIPTLVSKILFEA